MKIIELFEKKDISKKEIKLNGFPIQKIDVDFNFYAGDIIEINGEEKLIVREEHILEKTK